MVVAEKLKGPWAHAPLDERVLLAEMRARLLGRTTMRPQLGRYRLCERVGRGAQAVVYRGLDPVLDREVAVKVFAPRRSDQWCAGTTRREAQALAHLDHPSIVRVFDVGTVTVPGHDGPWVRDYVVLEFVAGTSLSERIAQGGLERTWVLETFVRAGRGLAAAHGRGLLHRDFKPSNVLLGRAGGVFVGDFGLAQRVAARAGVGAGAGTLAYMPPEQLEGRPLDVRADQYAFCVSLHETLFGERPSAASLAAMDARRDPLGPVLRRGLAPQRDDRYPSMEALLAALDRVCPRQTTSRPWRQWIVLAALAVGVGAAAELGSAPVRGSCAAQEVLLGTSNVDGLPPHLVVALEDYGERWARAREDACARAEFEPRLFDLQDTCLARGRQALAVVLEDLSGADPSDVATAVAGLPDISACSDVHALAAGIDPLEAGPRRRIVGDVLAVLEAARELVEQGRFADAAVLVEPAVEQARAAAYRPAQAEGLRRLGALQGQLGRPDRASALLRRAYFLARESGDDAVAREAAIELVYVDGILRSDAEAGLRWADHARAMLHGARGARLYLRTRLGQLYTQIGAFEEAQRELQWARTYALTAKLPRQHAFALAASCRLHTALGDHVQARRTCPAAVHEVFEHHPATHPGRAYALEGVAMMHRAEGDEAAARSYFEAAAAIAARARGPDHPVTVQLRAEARGEVRGATPG